MASHIISISVSNDLWRFIEVECQNRNLTPSQFFKMAIVKQHGLPIEWLRLKGAKRLLKRSGVSYETWEEERFKNMVKRANRDAVKEAKNGATQKAKNEKTNK